MFPVKTPYKISSDVSKFDEEFKPTFNSIYRNLKKGELDLYEDLLCGGQKYNVLLNRFCNLPIDYNIKDIALEIEEDVAILENGHLKSICFCFPSGFVPTKLIGLSLREIHTPVADNEKLMKGNDNLVKLISKNNQSFRRHVWTLTTLNKLSQLPEYKRPTPKSIDDLYFRTETQTTIGVDNITTLFFVKVNMYKFSILDKDQINQIKESVNSMSENVLIYKGLSEIKKVLNDDI